MRSEMNSNRYEISFRLKISLQCSVSSLPVLTWIEAKWNSKRYGFSIGHFISLDYVQMRGEMNSYRFEISNQRESPVYMKFHFGCISKRPIILMDMFRHFILGSVYMIFYHPKWNFISVKVTHMKSIPALSFKRTCALKSHAGLTFHFGQNDR